MTTNNKMSFIDTTISINCTEIINYLNIKATKVAIENDNVYFISLNK